MERLVRRFYLTGSLSPAPVSPAHDAGFLDVSVADWSMMLRERSAYAPILRSITVVSGGGPYLFRHYVSEPLAGGQVIRGPFKAQMRFHNALDEGANHDQVVSALKVVSGDGSAVRGVLLPIGAHGRTNVFANGAPSQNRMISAGVEVRPVAPLEGDRLSLEVGTRRSVPDDADDARVNARLWDNEPFDLPEDETFTDAANAWAEFPLGVSMLHGSAPFTTRPLAALASRTASLTGTGVYVGDLEGVLQFRFRHQALSGTSPTWAWTGQDSDDNATFASVPGLSAPAAAAGDVALLFDRARLRRYVRVLGTIGGSATPTVAGYAEATGWRKASAR